MRLRARGRLRRSRVALLVAAAALGAVAPAVAGGPALAMLGGLDDGRWELRVRGSDEVERLCLGDMRRLIQLRHPDEACRTVIVTDTPAEVVVQYTCPGRGYGRTRIRRETNRLVQLDTQGIARGLPFAFAAEARRVGACGG